MIRRGAARLYGVYAVTAFALIATLSCLLIVLCPGQRYRRRAGAAGMRLALRMMGIPFSVRGLQHLPAQPCIAVANHASYLDGLVLTAALPSCFSFVIKAEAARVPVLGLILRRMGAAFVTRTDTRRASLETRALIRAIGTGTSLAIFPEGTFASGPELLPFRRGAFFIASCANVPVIPVAIDGTQHVLPDGCWLPRRGRIRVELLSPLHADRVQPDSASRLRDNAHDAVRRQLARQRKQTQTGDTCAT